MRNLKIISTVAIACLTAPALAGTCATDLDGDGTTGFSDLTALLNGWGPCVGCPGDINGDNNVGFADLTELLNAWGPCPIVDVFPYPVYENLFALEVGQLFENGANGVALPQATYDRMDRDIGLIIAERPEVASSTAATTQWRWVPYQMLVGIDTALPSDNLDAALAYYQGEIIDEYFGGDILRVDFPLGANPIAMIPILEAIDSVEYAEMNGFSGTGPLTPRWEPTSVGGGALLWTVVVGWAQGEVCDINFSPCECFSTYEFLIQANGSLSLLGIDSTPSPWNADGTCAGYPPSP